MEIRMTQDEYTDKIKKMDEMRGALLIFEDNQFQESNSPRSPFVMLANVCWDIIDKPSEIEARTEV